MRGIKYILSICLIVVITSCSSSNSFEFPPYRLEMVNAKVDIDGLVLDVELDNGIHFTPQEEYRIKLTRGSFNNDIVRGISYLLFNNDNSRLIRMQGFGIIPILLPSTDVKFNDSGAILNVIRIWNSNKYINIEILVPKIESNLDSYFTTDTSPLNYPIHLLACKRTKFLNGVLELDLLHHMPENATLGNKEKLLMSIDIQEYIEKSDSLIIRLNIPLKDGAKKVEIINFKEYEKH